MTAWIAPAAIFSRPIIATGIGASTRSSISPTPLPSSRTSGCVTATMPWRLIATATSPGTRTVENDSPAGPARKPCPIFGNTYAKTKTKSTGCISVRAVTIGPCRRRTRRSRASRARNVPRPPGRTSA